MDYRITEETRGEVTYSERHGDDLDAACASLLEQVGGEAGMPGDTVEEIADYVREHGYVLVDVGSGCQWRLFDISST